MNKFINITNKFINFGKNLFKVFWLKHFFKVYFVNFFKVYFVNFFKVLIKSKPI